MCVCVCVCVCVCMMLQKSSPGGESMAADDHSSCCWENIIGQELFKLNLTHMMADMATMGLDMSRWILPRLPMMKKTEKWVHTMYVVVRLYGTFHSAASLSELKTSS